MEGAGYEKTGLKRQFSVWVDFIESIIRFIHTLPFINEGRVLIGIPKDIVKSYETLIRAIKNLLPVNYYTT